MAVKIADWPLQIWKVINGEVTTGPVGSTTDGVVINVGRVSVGHPL